tara:strand:+ start:1071 stop:1793 length:723 start_codon:yes stop_codon:yes gene_type:complete
MKTLFIRSLPEFVQQSLRNARDFFNGKNKSELNYWLRRHKIDNYKFKNDHYEKLMLSIADEKDDSFLKGKIIGDFGCGPRGSLAWAKKASTRIGIDCLAESYANAFPNDLKSHEMIYVNSTEEIIPIQSNYLDIIFTLNSIDHVDNFSLMCSEINRILKEGGILYGQFNLEEDATICEPQKLNEKVIRSNLLTGFEINHLYLTKKGPPDDIFSEFYAKNFEYNPGEEGFMWLKATKLPSK